MLRSRAGMAVCLPAPEPPIRRIAPFTGRKQASGMLDRSFEPRFTPASETGPDAQFFFMSTTAARADGPVQTGWRTLRRGRCFVYVLPWRESDVIKVGFSRDPLLRLQALHARYFEMFDLDRALLAETDYVRDARQIERGLKQALFDDATPPPLVVRDAAGGRTEWFRGAWPRATAWLERICDEDGHLLHPQLSAWLRVRWFRDDTLYAWSQQAWQQVEWTRFNGAPEQSRKLRGVLKNTLDACDAVGLRLEGKVPGAVVQWYRAGAGEVD